ncbi:MAG: tryptophan synthase subunit alpha [Gammaproteobacteria bacterium]|nr:tryptophan synthase subunit alpha [Gammaproteobacteria bacterium]
MSRYQNMFSRLKEESKIAFIPFVMLGDPDLETSFEIIKQLVDSGADALELGIPFSDPVADGPVIQAAAIRALKHQVNLDDCFELLKKIRETYSDIPVGLLLYSNLIYRKGIQTFYELCEASGVDSVLIADVPLRETEFFDSKALVHGIDPVHILPPEPSDNTLKSVAAQSKGYTYVLGRAGVTGTDVAAKMPKSGVMELLKENNAPPLVMGFGISKPEQVTAAKQHGFDGVISGSAVVKIIEDNLDNRDELLEALGKFVSSMKNAS